MAKSRYDVIVGNIGMVYSGISRKDAESKFNTYVVQSKEKYGRASGETVTLMRDNEVIAETEGSLQSEEGI